ncbi:glycosyltransferase family 4 protein [Synechococcus sp. BA-132 BA5]|uniref:glycosyltransferase family 4 protein n=1 Tax=Synechococcus sp. BA-132 BA5 TaxID=3110252 RepID=UPI002B1EEABF|nr:glycosyltransferase family 1 protein [Synechococcus sp. BA-132 BA5]MEA5414898.1 glycosyltransferase family 1 protein [Synechococcus sp. BA-132 BA5]
MGEPDKIKSMNKRVIVNAHEVFHSQGSGIKYFAKSLIQSVACSQTELAILVEVYSRDSHSLLADSNAFKVHPITHVGSLKRIAESLKIQGSLFLNPFGRHEIIHKISSRDPLYSLVLDSLNLAGGAPTMNSSESLKIYQQYKIFSRAKSLFASKRRLSTLSLASPDRKEADVIFHNPMPFPLVLKGAKNVVTIHDLIALTHPQFCLSDPGLEFELINQLVQVCDAVHSISHFTAESLCRLFGSGLESKIHVIPQATPPSTPFSDADSLQSVKQQVLSRFHETGEGYIIQLGTIEPKKNHLVMLEAFHALRGIYPKLRLVVVGKPGWLCEEAVKVLASASTDGLEWKGSLPRQSLEHYLTNSLALVFPSVVEGWGLPPLEAMASGTPAIVSQIPACMEACGDAALYVRDYHNPIAWVDAVQQMLLDSDFYLDKLEAGLQRAKQFQLSEFSSNLEKMYSFLA